MEGAAVGEPGDDILTRQAIDLGLRLSSMGDVRDRAHEATAGQRRGAHLKDRAVRAAALVGHLDGRIVWPHPMPDRQQAGGRRLCSELALGLEVLDERVEARGPPLPFGRQIEQLDEAAIDDGNRPIAPDKDDPLSDVVKRQAELLGGPQGALPAASRAGLHEGQAELVLGAAHAHADDDDRQQGRERAVRAQGAVGVHVDVRLAEAVGNDQRLSADPPIAHDAPLALCGLVGEGACLVVAHALEHIAGRDVLAEGEHAGIVDAAGRPHDAIDPDQGDGAARTEVDRGEKVGEVARVERGDDDAAERAVLPEKSPRRLD